MRVRMSLAALAIVAAPAAAQQSAAPSPAKGPSVDGYVCKFTGKCGGEPAAPDVTMDAGATKGFRLAKAAPDKPSPATPRAGYTSPRPAAHAGAAVRYGQRMPMPVRVVNPVSTMPAVAGAARPRADLMIGFDRNSAQLSRQGMASARVFAQALATPDLTGKRFLIEGHTDLRGGRPLNMTLSARRAQAVTEFLVAQGVDRSRLLSRGVGPDVPLPGHDASDPTNRRVEAELVP